MIYCDGWQRNRKEAGLWEEGEEEVEKCVCSCVPLTNVEAVYTIH